MYHTNITKLPLKYQIKRFVNTENVKKLMFITHLQIIILFIIVLEYLFVHY